jgi:hypothetical protein
VRGEENGCLCLASVALEKAAHPIRRVRIERGGGLIEEENLRPVEERLGKTDTSFLARGKVSGAAPKKIAEREIPRDLSEALPDIGYAVEPRLDDKVLAHGKTLG